MNNITPDPFAHHPEQRGKIADPLTSFFRTFGPKFCAVVDKVVEVQNQKAKTEPSPAPVAQPQKRKPKK
jgi:hypothetical protein